MDPHLSIQVSNVLQSCDRNQAETKVLAQYQGKV